MSYHAEHVIWKSKDETWAYGMFTRISNADNANQWREDDYDSEWDDDFDPDSFQIAQGGFPSADSANSHMRQRVVNPGHYEEHSKATAAERENWDAMLKAANDPVYAEELKKKREKAAAAAFRRQVRDSLRSLNIMAGKSYTIRFASKGPAVSGLGMVHIDSGALKQDGDWLVLETTQENRRGRSERVVRKVWNQKTKTQATNIISMTEQKTSYVWR